MLPPCYPHATMQPPSYHHAIPMHPLTVEVAAQQLKPQGGFLDHHEGLDADVARYDGRGEPVVLHTRAVHVSLKELEPEPENTVKLRLHF